MKALFWGLLIAATAGAVFWVVSLATEQPVVETRRPGSGARPASTPSNVPLTPDERTPETPAPSEPSRVALEPTVPRKRAEAPVPVAPAAAPGTPSVAETQPDLAPPPAIRHMQKAFEQWVASPENRDARAKLRPLDCRPPVCMLGVVYDSQRDGDFFSRAESFMQEEAELGHLISFPHRFSENETRIWYYWNPHEKGTAEHHSFNVGAIDRIKDDMKDLPAYYPVPRPGY